MATKKTTKKVAAKKVPAKKVVAKRAAPRKVKTLIEETPIPGVSPTPGTFGTANSKWLGNQNTKFIGKHKHD